MNLRMIRKISLCMVITSVILLKYSFSQNLAQNGGFETATVGLPNGTSFPAFPQTLDFWSAVNTDGEFLYDASLPHDGTGFMSVLQNAGANPATDWLGAPSDFSGYDRTIQLISVSGNATYTLRFWVRSGEGLRYDTYGAGTFFAQVEQYLPVPAPIDTIQGNTTADWEFHSLTFTTDASCTQIAILFSGFGADNNDVWIDDVEILEGKATGTNEFISSAGFSVYPNPSTGNFFIDLKNFSSSHVEINVFNELGQQVYEQDENGKAGNLTEEIQLDAPPGIYFLQLKTPTVTQLRTITLQ